MAPKAAVMFISGNVSANPEMARGPTPCPIKILSMMLYVEAAAVAMIAGTEYMINKCQRLSLARSLLVLFIVAFQKIISRIKMSAKIQLLNRKTIILSYYNKQNR